MIGMDNYSTHEMSSTLIWDWAGCLEICVEWLIHASADFRFFIRFGRLWVADRAGGGSGGLVRRRPHPRTGAARLRRGHHLMAGPLSGRSQSCLSPARSISISGFSLSSGLSLRAAGRPIDRPYPSSRRALGVLSVRVGRVSLDRLHCVALGPARHSQVGKGRYRGNRGLPCRAGPRHDLDFAGAR
jgi:hypothetical protein